METRKVNITYHREDGTWWADSEDMPGFSAAADTFAETRKLAHDGLPFFFEDERPAQIREFLDNGAELIPGNTIFVLPNPAGTHDGRIVSTSSTAATTTANRGIKERRMAA
jgi:predicted RNase H-like HicB family nuclease